MCSGSAISVFTSLRAVEANKGWSRALLVLELEIDGEVGDMDEEVTSIGRSKSSGSGRLQLWEMRYITMKLKRENTQQSDWREAGLATTQKLPLRINRK